MEIVHQPPFQAKATVLQLKEMTRELPLSLQNALGSHLIDSMINHTQTEINEYIDVKSLGAEFVMELHHKWYDSQDPAEKAFMLLDHLSENHLSQIHPKIKALINFIADYQQQQVMTNSIKPKPIPQVEFTDNDLKITTLPKATSHFNPSLTDIAKLKQER